uniref:asparagine--tRNA ligase n=1 Tax=Lotharella oceanica TaxID=641309 RepID=A0A7S2TF26_9EUKA
MATPAEEGGAKATTTTTAPLFKRSRTVLKDILDGDAKTFIGKSVTVCGWMQTIRTQGQSMAFVELNDGSCCGSLQVILDKEYAGEGVLDAAFEKGGTGVSCKITGEIVKSPKSGQAVELKAKTCIILGAVDAKAYPMPKKALTLEYMRTKQTWRIRTKTMRAVQTIRNMCAWATHSFFQGHGMKYVHTPILTGADCEGAGEMFSVTTMLKDGANIKDIPTVKDSDGKIDFSKDFFGKSVSLTVSGQLNVETYACAFSDVYTFGPTFRAEHSNTSRHLAEFWMIEPEICFATLEDDMALAEDYVKYVVDMVISKCGGEVDLLTDYYQRDYNIRKKQGKVGKNEQPPSPHRKNLEALLGKPYKRLSYTEAIEILEKEIKEYRAIVITPEEQKKMKAKDLKKKTKGKHLFSYPVFWGVDLASEHEKYLTDKIFNGPVILYNYPKDIKAFYMKMNEDNKTVQAMDMLVPGIGELIGGSAREDDLNKLLKRCEETKMEVEPLQWYLDLRKFGSVPHAGFGLGFERLVMLTTGMQNIKDVIPFPRSYGVCDY